MQTLVTDLPPLDSPEFAPIKYRLTRAYLEHRADVVPPHVSDESIILHADDITALLFGAMARAVAANHGPWFARYAWFTDLLIELFDDVPGRPLDG
jgi:hypothetical protein